MHNHSKPISATSKVTGQLVPQKNNTLFNKFLHTHTLICFHISSGLKECPKLYALYFSIYVYCCEYIWLEELIEVLYLTVQPYEALHIKGKFNLVIITQLLAFCWYRNKTIISNEITVFSVQSSGVTKSFFFFDHQQLK